VTSDEVVRGFLAAWERRDTEAIVRQLTDDAVYHAMPLTPIVGKPALREWIAGRAAVPAPKIVMHHQVARGNVVMNERTDHLVLNGRPVTLEICAVFEISDGRIRAWREYFDPGPAKAAYEQAP
jgi:limonene-1,2-epoxide hydrolase